jgi:hypothetical protein
VSRSASLLHRFGTSWILGDDVARGPFQHDHNYFKSLLSAFLLRIKELPLEQHAFFAPILELQEFETFVSHKSIVN